MADPHVMRKTRLAYVTILGRLWMGGIASIHKDLSDYDLGNIGEFTRENMEDWLTSHAGDFQEVIDFMAVCGKEEIPWSSEDNEMTYLDTISDGE